MPEQFGKTEVRQGDGNDVFLCYAAHGLQAESGQRYDGLLCRLARAISNRFSKPETPGISDSDHIKMIHWEFPKRLSADLVSKKPVRFRCASHCGKITTFDLKPENMTSLSLYTKLETLPSDLKEEAKNFIEKLIDKSKDKEKHSGQKVKLQKREFGALKGKIHLSADFDEPLEEFKDYM